MDEGPKLYEYKPKKGKLKKIKGIDVSSSKSSANPAYSGISSYYSTGNTANGGGGSGSGGGSGIPKPPEVPKVSFVRRYKYMWPLLLTVNLAVGAYLFMRTKKKDIVIEEEIPNPPTPTPTPTLSTSTTPPTTKPITESLPAAQPVRVLEPIPDNQQRELFKWMLEEKRKIKTNDPEEKKRLDEEKAILKHFIRATSIPSF